MSNDNWWTLAGGFVVAVVTAVTTAVVTIMTAKSKNEAESAKTKTDAEDAAVKRYRELIGHQATQIDALETKLDSMGRRVEALSMEHLACHSAIQSLYTWASFSHTLNVKFAKSLGLDPSNEVPPLPPRPLLQISPSPITPTNTGAGT